MNELNVILKRVSDNIGTDCRKNGSSFLDNSWTTRNFLQGICNEPQANGPIDNQSNDDLIGEYNSMRPCTKEYSIYKLDQDQANRKRDQDLFTFCTTEVRTLKFTYNL